MPEHLPLIGVPGPVPTGPATRVHVGPNQDGTRLLFLQDVNLTSTGVTPVGHVLVGAHHPGHPQSLDLDSLTRPGTRLLASVAGAHGNAKGRAKAEETVRVDLRAGTRPLWLVRRTQRGRLDEGLVISTFSAPRKGALALLETQGEVPSPVEWGVVACGGRMDPSPDLGCREVWASGGWGDGWLAGAVPWSRLKPSPTPDPHPTITTASATALTNDTITRAGAAATLSGGGYTAAALLAPPDATGPTADLLAAFLGLRLACKSLPLPAAGVRVEVGSVAAMQVLHAAVADGGVPSRVGAVVPEQVALACGSLVRGLGGVGVRVQFGLVDPWGSRGAGALAQAAVGSSLEMPAVAAAGVDMVARDVDW